jgi:hypothetical protein
MSTKLEYKLYRMGFCFLKLSGKSTVPLKSIEMVKMEWID